mmetsp:Transcript_8890/g.17688  ORF Transcript_8890/g.17688 Transcript_8890/m.17688 type:complete len:286 (-) Transcript_8890:1949-2806(-)
MDAITHGWIFCTDSESHRHIMLGIHTKLQFYQDLCISNNCTSHGDGVAACIWRYHVCSIADGHSHEFNHCLYRFLDIFTFAECIRVGYFIGFIHGIPCFCEIRDTCGFDVVCWRHVQILQLIFVVESLFFCLSSGWINFLDFEFQYAWHGSCCGPIACSPQNDVCLASPLGWRYCKRHCRFFFKVRGICQVEEYANIFQHLLRNCICNVELEYIMRLQHMVDKKDIVFSFLLCKLCRSARLKHRSKGSHFWNRNHLLCILCISFLCSRTRCPFNNSCCKSMRLVS